MKRYFAFLPLLLLVGCQEEKPAPLAEIDVYVDSKQKACSGFIRGLCLLTKNSPDGTYAYQYEAIRGFNYVWGHTYHLKVLQYETPDYENVQDVSQYYYELKSVVQNSEDAVGTEYNVTSINPYDNEINYLDNNYSLFGKAFNCNDEANCSGLLELNSSNDLIDLHFIYNGSGEINLTSWSFSPLGK